MRKLLAVIHRWLTVHVPARILKEKNDKIIYIKEMGIQLSIPSRMIAVTRETDRNALCFKQIGETAASLRKRNLYLRAVDPKRTYELWIRARKDDGLSFMDMDEKTIENMQDGMAAYWARQGMTKYKSSTHVSGGIRYLCESYQKKRGGPARFSKKYSTVHDGRAFTVVLDSIPPHSLTGKTRILERIVESIRLSDLETVPEQSSNLMDEYTGGFEVIYDWKPPEECSDGWAPITYESDLRRLR